MMTTSSGAAGALVLAALLTGITDGRPAAAGLHTESRYAMEDEAAMRFLAADEGDREEWQLDIAPGRSREYITTNKVATHFSCEAAGRHSRSYHGLYCSMHEYLDSWTLNLPGGTLDPGRITAAAAFPWRLYRWYGAEGVMEEIALPDGQNGLIVRFSGIEGGSCGFVPWVDMRFIWDVPRPDYRIFWEEDENVLLISRLDDPFAEGMPAWIAVTSDAPMRFRPDEVYRSTTYPKDMARKAMGRTQPFSPGELSFDTPAGGKATFVVGLGAGEDEAVAEAKR
ncbi:MAG TPA: hypothetical protein VLA34_05395, partial [Candidatus Krumholzibacterium sp.]|nr:hypothetical protein [Candidatus Krumholzibacterium sp.]